MGLGELAAVAVTIRAITKPLDDAMKGVRGQLADLSVGKGIGVIAIGNMVGSAALGAIKLAVEGVKELITATFDAAKSAASLQMEMHRIRVIFNGFAPQVTATIAGLAKTFGYTRGELADMASKLGNLFIGMGLGEQLTAELAQSFLKLGVNASIIHGMDLPEFMQRLDMAVMGSTKSLHKLGMFFSDAQIQMEAWKLSSQGARFTSEEQAKYLSIMSLMLKSSANSSGQAEWAQKQLGGTLRETSGRFNELFITLGEITKPAWEAAIKAINGALMEMEKWVDRNRDSLMRFGQGIADYIGNAGVYWKNFGIQVQVAGLYVKEAMQLSGVWFGYFLDTVATGLVWIQNNWKTALVDIGTMTMTAFKNIASNFTTFSTWFGANWKNLWDDLRNIVTTTLGNLGANFKNFGEAAYNWIKSGFRSPFEFKMMGLGEGAGAAKTEGLPEFKAILDGFKAVSEKLEFPGVPKDKLKEINDEFERRIKIMLKKMGVPVAGKQGQGKDELGGIPRPGVVPGGGRTEGGFVAITEMWRNIQTGANTRDAAVLATARNTQRIAEMVAMFGPRMVDVFLMAGGAGP